MRVFILLIALTGCGIRSLSPEEISILDGNCPFELFEAGICDDPPLVPKPISD